MAVSPWVRRIVVPIADKIVYASTAYVSVKSTLNQLGDQLIDFSGPVTGPADERLREAVRLVRPMTGEGLRLLRVGGDHDGGYVMADDFAVSGAVSIGVGPDVSWDVDVAGRGIPVALFDPTVRRLPTPVPGGRFHRVGVSGLDRTQEYRPLPELVRMAGFAGRTDLLLKVDVEGAEWSALAALTPADLAPYRQMAFELHGLSDLADPDRARQVLDGLALLAEGHVPIHVHANNYDDLVRFDRAWFPNAIEVSYVRRDLLPDPVPSTSIASPLDRPCDPRVPEIPLEGILAL